LLARLRPLFWPVLLLVLAAVVYRARVQKEMIDFEVVRTVGTRALHAEPLYRASDGHWQFKYLPAFALAVAPLALVDREAGKAIWFALSAGLLTAFIRWSIRALPERRRSDRTLTWLTLLFMAKFYAHDLLLGQTNIPLATLLMAALLAVQIDKPLVAGGLLGLATFTKPYALLLLPWLGFTYGWMPLAAAAGVVAAGLLLPALVYGWTGNINLLVAWYHTVTSSTEGNLLGADNISLAAMWAKWIGIGTPAAALATISIGAALGLVAVVWLQRQRVREPDYLEFSLLMLLIPLISPQGWDYVLLLGTPAVVCLLDRWSDVPVGWRLYTGAALFLMGLTMFDLMGRELYGRFMALSIVTVAAMSLAVAVWNLRRRGLA
jgi:hypothetical protein